MNFERGIDQKDAMQIGIMEKARIVLKRLINENTGKLIGPESRKTKDKIEKQFKEEVGLDLEIKISMTRESLDFYIYRPANNITITTVIRPWDETGFLD